MSMPCTGCGWEAPEGSSGCQALFGEFLARDFSNVAYGRSHRLIVDTYCLQHPDRYCVSAKSLAAHLGGLCRAFEHGARPEAYQALQRWLNGRSSIEKPELPSSRGAVTIADVQAASDAAGYAQAVERWARSTWEAYAILHPMARRYMDEALAVTCRFSAGAEEGGERR
jgi:hypothetical protein